MGAALSLFRKLRSHSVPAASSEPHRPQRPASVATSAGVGSTVRLAGFIREGRTSGGDVDQAERMADLVGDGDRQLLAGQIVIDVDLPGRGVVEAVERRARDLKVNRQRGAGARRHLRELPGSRSLPALAFQSAAPAATP